MLSQPLGFTAWRRVTVFFDTRAKEREIASFMLFLCKSANIKDDTIPLSVLLLRTSKFRMLRDAVAALENTRRLIMTQGGKEFCEGYDEYYRTHRKE